MTDPESILLYFEPWCRPILHGMVKHQAIDSRSLAGWVKQVEDPDRSKTLAELALDLIRPREILLSLFRLVMNDSEALGQAEEAQLTELGWLQPNAGGKLVIPEEAKKLLRPSAKLTLENDWWERNK